MKAVILTGTSAERLDTLFRKRQKPNFTELVSSLERLGADEVLITGQNTMKSRLSDWFERERGRFQMPVTFRFHEDLTDSGEMEPLMRLIRHEGLEDSVLLVFLNDGIPVSLDTFKKTLHLHPYSPVIGVKKPGHDSVASAVWLGERNRIIRFSPTGARQENEWEPMGAYYFPERFLSEGIPAFVKFASQSFPAFETFVSWSVRSFKVYAHVFAARSGF